MVNQVIKLTGSSNHNKCAKAHVKDPKAWCYTTDSNKRWEHCNQLCTGLEDPDNSDELVVGTRFRDIPEQEIDPRSKYDQNGNCIKNCRSRSFFTGIQQCGRNECLKPKPHLVQIYSWFEPPQNLTMSLLFQSLGKVLQNPVKIKFFVTSSMNTL